MLSICPQRNNTQNFVVMNEKLLCKCTNITTAHNVVSILENDDIVFRRHDETTDTRTGAYGPMPGIAIYVFEKDYEKAYSLIEPIINSTAESAKPFCPKCGSEDIEHIERGKYVTHLYILSILFFLAGFCYLLASAEYNIKSVVMDWLSLVMIVLFVVSGIIAGRKSKNCKCKHCGKRFDRI